MRDMQEFPGTADRPGGVTRARFQILFGSASVNPQRMGWPTPDGRGPVALGVAWANTRWRGWQTWLVAVPVIGYFGLGVADQAVRLLPNLM